MNVNCGASGLWPVYEFRPLDRDLHGTVLRYADGAWLPDDGEWDIAFVSYGMGSPLGLYVDLPYQRNIIWSGLTTHWSGYVVGHPRGGNPWHYMLRDGETEWGGPWAKDGHPNAVAGRRAMSKCCSINGCANGRGPEFHLGDPYIELRQVRDRETKQVVEFPEKPTCMFCGEGWQAALRDRDASLAEDAQRLSGEAVAARTSEGGIAR